MNHYLQNPPAFEAYGTQHLVSLLVGAIILVWLLVTSRSGKFPRLEKAHIWIMVACLGVCWPLNFWIYPIMGYLRPWPMHLCDLAGFCGMIALLTRGKRRIFVELTYFWGLAGTINGLITPDLAAGFPHPRFWGFFLLHLGVVITAIWLVAGMRAYPRRGSVWKVFGITQIYVLVAGLVNLLTGHNYGFLRHKPENVEGSLLDLLGPWPIYILWLELVALGLFWLLYMPFVRRNRS
ncbi:MAG: TIGR02206 family membrane protein [Verrucomicrobiota bacterium]